MKILIALSALILSQTAFAGCKEDFRYLQNKEKVKLVKERQIEIHNKRQMKYLIDPELKAVIDYMKFMEFTFDGDNGLAITTEHYRERKDDKGLGYRVSITDGGEQSEVRYYLKQDKSEWNYPILYRVWNGQRRVSEYICE